MGKGTFQEPEALRVLNHIHACLEWCAHPRRLGIYRGSRGGYHHATCHPMTVDSSSHGQTLSVVCHNAQERGAQVDWVVGYTLLPIHYLCRLHPNLNTWFISVEDEVEDINLPRISAIHFDLEHRIFDATHMIANFLFSPPEPALMQPIIRANPDLDPATTEHE